MMTVLEVIIGIFAVLELVAGCTTKGIMPLRDQSFRPFCCHPAYGNAHCPEGARCERDTYYGYGYVCCGSVNMVWDAFGGSYKKSNYAGRGKIYHRYTVAQAPKLGRWPRWNGWTAATRNNSAYDFVPPGWRRVEDGPLIAPIVVGEYREVYNTSDGASGGWKGKGSVTLVRDGPCTILVDTGLAIDDKMIVKGLAANDLRVDDIQYVVVTQGTPEHMGNQNLFRKSTVLYAWMAIKRDHFTVTDLGKTDFIPLCSRTELRMTPGVTKDAISVFVHNVTGYGTVAIVGDVFLYDHAYDFIPKQFASVIWDVQAMLQSREKVLCLADWIFPGHGAKFSSQSVSNGRYNCSNVNRASSFRKVMELDQPTTLSKMNKK